MSRKPTLTTLVGGGTVRSSKTPVVERICHSATSSTGPRSRCSERGTTRRLCRLPNTARGSTSTRSFTAAATVVVAGERESTVAMSGGPEELARYRFRLAAVGSDRNIADQRDAVQDPVAIDVLEVSWGEVQCGPVVPERNASRRPLESHRILGTRDFLE